MAVQNLKLECKHGETLVSKAGFEVEGFGGGTVIVQAVPNPHRYFDAERAFREMVHELTHGSDLVRAARKLAAHSGWTVIDHTGQQLDPYR